MGDDGCQPRTPAGRRQRHGCQPGHDDSCQPSCATTGRPLRVGTDCSGLDTPIAALEEILLGRNRQIHHVFSSECDPMTLKILLDNFTPDYHYTDVARRRHPPVEQLPSLDIYVAGFPCQTFSSCGLSAGVGYYCRPSHSERGPQKCIQYRVTLWSMKQFMGRPLLQAIGQ